MNHIIKSSSHNKSQICPQLFGLIYNRGFSAKNFQFSFLLTSFSLSKRIENEQYNIYRYGKRTLFKGIIVYFPKNLTFSKSDFNFLRYLPLKPKTRQRMALPRGRLCPGWLYIFNKFEAFCIQCTVCSGGMKNKKNWLYLDWFPY